VLMEMDGNCLFSAVCYQLCNVQDKSSQFSAHLSALGIIHEQQCKPDSLREVVLNEMESHPDRYMSFLTKATLKTYREQVQQFRKSGQFATDFGDLIPVAIADTLGTILILLSSNPSLSYQSIIPQGDIFLSLPLFLSFNCSGAGHYDGTRPANPTLQQHGNTDKLDKMTCRCGINNKTKKGSPAFCKSQRCPCLKDGRKCSDCKCYNCENKCDLPKDDELRKSTDKRFSKLSRTTGSDFLSNLRISARGIKWTVKEDLLLYVISQDKTSVQLICQLYNQHLKAGRIKGEPRTKSQIVSRLTYFKKMKRCE
jgi:hypothetical protein